MKNIKFIKDISGDYIKFNFGLGEEYFNMDEIYAIKCGEQFKAIKFYNENGGYNSFECFENPKNSFIELNNALQGLPYMFKCSKDCIVNINHLIDFSSVNNNKNDIYRLNLHFKNNDITCNIETAQELKIIEILLRNRLEKKESNLQV